MGDSDDRTKALAEVNRKVQPNLTPKLDPADVEAILDNNKRASRWTASVALDLGATIMPTVRNGKVYVVTKAGTTGGTEPTWPPPSSGFDSLPVLSGDGGVAYQEAGPDYTNVYDIRRTIQECYAMKLAIAQEFDNSEDGNESSIVTHLEKMVQSYGRPMIA